MTAHPADAPTVATRDHSMKARVVRRVPLLYANGSDALTDRPAHVRAGSGMAWIGDRLAVIQDDANFIALVDAGSGHCEVVVLPAGHGGLRQFHDGRGNKRYKHDFEALVAIGCNPTQLIAFGSGSSSRRESILVIPDVAAAPSTVRVVRAPQFYAGLRASAEFGGSELNVEGATIVDEHVRLFNRGNGASTGARVPVNATCDINCAELLSHLEDPARGVAPSPQRVTQFVLGDVEGVRLSFTDAVAAHDAVMYVAAAEASPDAVRDGAVFGSAIGVIETRDGRRAARWTPLSWSDGAIARVKVEGVALGRRAGRLFVVVDGDEHDKPSELFELEISGFARD
ncbi:MAG: hypothetical protein ABI120_25540 [Gemmatimonadaceae bacterium]